MVSSLCARNKGGSLSSIRGGEVPRLYAFVELRDAKIAQLNEQGLLLGIEENADAI